MKTQMPKKEIVDFDPFNNEHLMDFYRVRFLGQPSVNNYVVEHPFKDFISQAHYSMSLKVLFDAKVQGKLPDLKPNKCKVGEIYAG